MITEAQNSVKSQIYYQYVSANLSKILWGYKDILIECS